MNRFVRRSGRTTALLMIAVIILSVVVFPLKTPAEEVSGDLFSGFSAFLYNNSNGLPTSEANAIAQTGNGFIYIGSYSGLIRYDGVNFTRFDSSAGITGVVSLYVDSRDRLWIGTNDSGIALYENGEFTFFDKSNGLLSLSIRSITEDGAGNIIAATTDGLAYIDAENDLHMLSGSDIDEKYFKQVTRGNDGVVYGCTIDGICFRMEDLRITHTFDSREKNNGVASCIVPDDDGTVWIGTEDSSVIHGNMYNGFKRCRIYGISPYSNVNSIIKASEGAVWICSDNGIGLLDEDGSFTVSGNSPMNNSVENMMSDYEGNLWFVSSRQGVMKIVRNDFTDINAAAGLGDLVVNTTCLYGEDLYVGTDNGLLILDKDLRLKTEFLTELLKGTRVRCVKTDSENRVWLCTYGDKGLICYPPDGRMTCYNTATGLCSDRVHDVAELPDGAFCAATTGGAALIENEKVTKIFDDKNGLGNIEILTVCAGDEDKIYLGSEGGGIYIIDRENVIKRLGMEDGLRSEIITRIKKDPNGNGYWVITGNSIAYMENEKIRTLTNFPYSNNLDIFFGENGRVWILSSNGIYAANSENLLSDRPLEYSFYDAKCGLPSVATANSRSCISDDGTLYIAGMTGVSSVNINKERSEIPDESDIKLSVPFVEIDGKTVAVKNGETVKIPADCKRLTIYGYALTFGLSNPRLSYRLEGFDDNEFSVTRQDMQPVSYTNLEHGDYTFHLAIVDTMTGEKTDMISVKFHKKKAFFEEIWFWLLVVLAAVAALLAALLLRSRIKNRILIKREEENNLFVNQIIKAFAKCIDLKDTYTNGHSFRVAAYSAMIAEKMGYEKPRITEVYNIGLLHDIGKITVPDSILGKPERLTKEEYEIIRHHAENGYKILKEIGIRPQLAIGAGYHHEHIDGSGYPFGKKGDEIPEAAQIIAVADTFDAMNSTRPYRKQMKMEDIFDEMRRIAGTQLNAEIVEIFLKLVEEGCTDEIATMNAAFIEGPTEETKN